MGEIGQAQGPASARLCRFVRCIKGNVYPLCDSLLKRLRNFIFCNRMFTLILQNGVVFWAQKRANGKALPTTKARRDMKILGIAALLLMISLYAFLQAINLIPTDLGFTWMTGGFILFAASALLVGLEFARASVVQALRMGAMVSGIARATALDAPAPPRNDPPMNAPEAAPAVAADTAQPGATSGKSGLATAAAIGAAGLAAGAAASMVSSGAKADSPLPAAEEPPAPVFDLPPLPPREAKAPVINDSFLDDLERDLFAEAGNVPASTPEAAPEAKAEADLAKEIPAIDSLADDLFATKDAPTEADTPATEPTLAEDAAPAPEPAPVIDAPDLSREIAADDALPRAGQPTADDVPMQSPGLIADADLEALETEEPPLAPLETLDVVGAYDSGGTRFTMYSDGSVTAIGPTMDKRFASLDALRAFIDAGAKT